MGLDIRWPIGIIFVIYGVILILYGFIIHPNIPGGTIQVDIDFWWGLALLVFGLFMGALALRASRRAQP
jgi:hypothetical protein